MKLNSMASRREFLKELSTSELDRMLQAELRKETIDDDLVRLVLSVLEDREQDYPVEINEEIAAAAEKFGNSIVAPQIAPARKKWPPVLKAASILVVVGMLLFALPQAAHAENFFEMIARWTDSVFEFFVPVEPDKQSKYVFETEHPGLQQIYDAVVEMGVTDPVVPMWVPDGYELAECKVTDFEQEKSIQAVLKKGKFAIAFRLLILTDDINVNIYKDQDEATTYEHNGVTYYVLNNEERQIATWNSDDTVCSVAVDCQEDILFEIIKSIYTLEGN